MEQQIRDDKPHYFYTIDQENWHWYDNDLEDAMTKTEKAILTAVVRNEIDELRDLLDSPKWYQITDIQGYNLLQICAIYQSKEVFDYLLSLPEFPLELANDKNETALITAIHTIQNREGANTGDHFAFELIRKGADVFCLDRYGKTTVTCAALSHHVGLAKLLIERGVELDRADVLGNTALHKALESVSPHLVEFVCLLLYKGADPRIANQVDLVPFETSVLCNHDEFLQETLFYYMYDEYSKFEIHLSVLLKLMMSKSVLVDRIDGVLDDFSRIYITELFYIDAKYLKMLVEKFPVNIGEVLRSTTFYYRSWDGFAFENVEFLLESDLRDDLVTCIQNTQMGILLVCLTNSHTSKNMILDVISFLLTCGLEVTEGSLHQIYRLFGYTDLLKLMLNLDIRMGDHEKLVMPTLLYNVKFDLQSYLDNHEEFSKCFVDHLLRYFANGQVYDLCSQSCYRSSSDCDLRKPPDVPLLVEMARNTFRKYFIERFKIETSKQFYTLINSLNINNIYKKIITYETKLY